MRVPFSGAKPTTVPIHYAVHARKWDEIAIDGGHRGPGIVY